MEVFPAKATYFLFFFGTQSAPLSSYKNILDFLRVDYVRSAYVASFENFHQYTFDINLLEKNSSSPKENLPNSGSGNFAPVPKSSAESAALKFEVIPGVSVKTLVFLRIENILNPWNLYFNKFNFNITVTHSKVSNILAPISFTEEDYWKIYFKYYW